MKKLVILALTLAGIGFAQWSPRGGGNHGGSDWTPSPNEVISGYHYGIGTFTIPSGQTNYVLGNTGSADTSGHLRVQPTRSASWARLTHRAAATAVAAVDAITPLTVNPVEWGPAARVEPVVMPVCRAPTMQAAAAAAAATRRARAAQIPTATLPRTGCPERRRPVEPAEAIRAVVLVEPAMAAAAAVPAPPAATAAAMAAAVAVAAGGIAGNISIGGNGGSNPSPANGGAGGNNANGGLGGYNTPGNNTDGSTNTTVYRGGGGGDDAGYNYSYSGAGGGGGAGGGRIALDASGTLTVGGRRHPGWARAAVSAEDPIRLPTLLPWLQRRWWWRRRYPTEGHERYDCFRCDDLQPGLQPGEQPADHQRRHLQAVLRFQLYG